MKRQKERSFEMEQTWKEWYEQGQKEWIEIWKIEEGDTVEVTGEAISYRMGWNNYWIREMDDCIGKSYIIEKIMPDNLGIQLKDFIAYFPLPYFVLKLISHKPPISSLPPEIEEEIQRTDWIPECKRSVKDVVLVILNHLKK
jgi:hypothetical protein